MNYKYTPQGDKVVVISPLNQKDFIVQKVYVTESGEEIPSGTNIVVSELLDAPAKSWKEVRLEELESSYENSRRKWENSIREQNNRLSLEYDKLKMLADYFRDLNKHSEPALETLVNFLEGKITHLVTVSGSNSVILDDFKSGRSVFCHTSYSWESNKLEGLKLLTLFGNSDGNLEWGLNRYPDGSDRFNSVVKYFTSRQDAITYIQNLFDERERDWVDNGKSFCIKYFEEIDGVVISPTVRSLVREKEIMQIQDTINRYQERIDIEKNKLTSI